MYLLNNNPYGYMYNKIMPFTLSVNAYIYDTYYEEKLTFEKFKEDIDKFKCEQDKIDFEDRFVFTIMFDIYTDNTKRKIFYDMFSKTNPDFDYTHIVASMCLELIMIATEEDDVIEGLEEVLDQLPDVDFDKLTNIRYFNKITKLVDKAINNIFKVLSDNELVVMNQIATFYNLLGTLLDNYEKKILKLQGPFYLNDAQKTNKYFRQDCSIGPVMYFPDGLSFKDKKEGGEKNA